MKDGTNADDSARELASVWIRRFPRMGNPPYVDGMVSLSEYIGVREDRPRKLKKQSKYLEEEKANADFRVAAGAKRNIARNQEACLLGSGK